MNSEELIERMAKTKTMEELLETKAQVQGLIAISPSGEYSRSERPGTGYYGQLCMALLRINKAIDIKKNSDKEE
jgi:hypothetical protein